MFGLIHLVGRSVVLPIGGTTDAHAASVDLCGAFRTEQIKKILVVAIGNLPLSDKAARLVGPDVIHFHVIVDITTVSRYLAAANRRTAFRWIVAEGPSQPVNG